jgi:hypothetical protein
MDNYAVDRKFIGTLGEPTRARISSPNAPPARLGRNRVMAFGLPVPYVEDEALFASRSSAVLHHKELPLGNSIRTKSSILEPLESEDSTLFRDAGAVTLGSRASIPAFPRSSGLDARLTSTTIEPGKAPVSPSPEPAKARPIPSGEL